MLTEEWDMKRVMAMWAARRESGYESNRDGRWSQAYSEAQVALPIRIYGLVLGLETTALMRVRWRSV